MRIAPIAVALGLAAGLSACVGITEADRAPRTDPAARLAPPGPSPWRVAFDDPVLADLLRRADAGALDVKIAIARLNKARADVESVEAARGVRVTVGVDAAAGGRTFNDPLSAGTPTAEATYTVDFWGRLAHARDAVASERVAADADIGTVRLVVAAETVRTYAALRAAQADHAADERRLGLAQRAAALQALRFQEGAVTAEALAAARQTAAAATAKVGWGREEEALQATKLADLLDDPKLTLPAGGLPQAPTAPGGATSELVDGRPDVQAALARLRAADARRASQVAASRPQVQISALLGAPDAAIATLLDTRMLAWALAGTISQDILDGGAIRARVHGASAEADEAELTYRKTVRTAWSEIHAALIEQARAGREAALASEGLAQAQAALRAGQLRHSAGAADGLAIAALQGDLETAAAQVRQAQAHAVEARVQLALATGGR